MKTIADEPIVKDAPSQIPLHLQPRALKPGLYIVATPIGNMGDITLRALEVLHACAHIACEDTRQTGKLTHRFGIRAKLESYHDHNAAQKRPALLALAKESAVALVSDAGTPLISDPGYKLVREAVEAGIRVEALPGASSVMTALCIAGLPTDRFLFEGFLPAGAKQARDVLSELAPLPSTLVFFESAKRVAATLALMTEVLGAREACVARELTKLYEEAVRGTLPELAQRYAGADAPKGEIVLVVGPPPERVVDEAQLDMLLQQALTRLSLKDAVAETCALLSLPRGRVYARALALREQP